MKCKTNKYAWQSLATVGECYGTYFKPSAVTRACPFDEPEKRFCEDEDMDWREADERSHYEKPGLMVEDVTMPKFAYGPHSFLQSSSRQCGGYIKAVARLGKSIGVLQGGMDERVKSKVVRG